jgi:hypothetical protein
MTVYFEVIDTPTQQLAVSRGGIKLQVTVGGKNSGNITLKWRPSIAADKYDKSIYEVTDPKYFDNVGNSPMTSTGLFDTTQFEDWPGGAGAGVINLATASKRTIFLQDVRVSAILVADDSTPDGDGKVEPFWVNIELVE